MGNDSFGLPPGKWDYIPIPVPKRMRVSIFVDSEPAIGIYLMDRDGFADFKAGLGFWVISGRRRTRSLEISPKLPQGKYYLVLDNNSDEDAEVDWAIE